jgi:hypothetical protein
VKLLEHFKTFMENQVNLNGTRISLLEDSIEAIKSAVRASSWGARVVMFRPQGSWAHETIIKPLPGDEFDADLIAFVAPKEAWESKDYVNKLVAALEANSTYSGKVQRYSHCATIEYAGERRIDIAPCVRDRLYPGQYEVCNRISNEFEASEPIAYTQWVVDKNSIAGGNGLKEVTRLLKYMRDIKGNFTCPSFLFTTLLGYQIYEFDRDSAVFSDLPTTLKTLVGRLDDWLQARSSVPDVRNPVLSSEIQSAVWTETQYSNFRDKINLYRGWIDDAYDEEDRDESIGKWQRVFGDDFAAGEAKEAARVSESVVRKAGLVAVAGPWRDLVDMVKAVGAKALPDRLMRLPYMRRPMWRQTSTALTVKVKAELRAGNYSGSMHPIASLEPLQKGYSAQFTAVNGFGAPFPPDYAVKWRVTNTDKDAYNAGQLRGDFYRSDRGTSRTEYLKYRGVHLVEAFLIRKRDNRLAGKSDPFFVVIE